MEVRIGVTYTPKEIEIELAEDTDRDKLIAAIEQAVSAEGKVLWLTGRWSGVVYAIDTRNGKLLQKIPVGSSPHGLCVWPQPGRYSLGHTGILR